MLRTKVVVKSIVAGLAMILLAGACASPLFGLPNAGAEEGAIRASISVADGFMRAGKRNDSRAGFELFSESRRDAEVTLESIDELFKTRRELFEDYETAERAVYGATVGNGLFRKTVSIEGKFSYSTRDDVPFKADFVRDAGEWKLVRIVLP